MPMAPRSWRAALALLVLGPGSAVAADQCAVNDLAIDVWPRRVHGPRSSCFRRAPGEGCDEHRPTAGHHGIRGFTWRFHDRSDQERLFTAVYEGDLPEVQRLLVSPSVDVNAPVRSDRRSSLIDIAAAA